MIGVKVINYVLEDVVLVARMYIYIKKKSNNDCISNISTSNSTTKEVVPVVTVVPVMAKLMLDSLF